MHCTLKFGADGVETRVARDAHTARFHCPRCNKSYQDPGCLQRHARRETFCDRTRHGARWERPASAATQRGHLRGRPPGRSAVASTGTVVAALSNDVRPAKSPLPARVHRARHKTPQTTRTQRALIRDYWKQEYTVAQISEWMRCGPREVWYSINNGAEDNLDEDEQYLLGEVGDIVNVDNLSDDDFALPEPHVKSEDLEMKEVDEKVNEHFDGSEEDDEHEVEFNWLLRKSLESPPGHENKLPDNHVDDAGGSSLGSLSTSSTRTLIEDSNAGIGSEQIQTASSPSPSSAVRCHNRSASPAPPVAGPSFAAKGKEKEKEKEKHIPPQPQSSSSASAQVPSGRSADVVASPVGIFLDSLMRPLRHLQGVLCEFGIETAADLDALCEMTDQWDLLKDFLLANGLKPFQWMTVKDGLRLRVSGQQR